jgi:hypothetical protein
VLVEAAIKRGLLPELNGLKCMDCGEPAECYDHRNYHHPLAVDPVCKGCNNRRGPGFPPLQEGDGGMYRNEHGRIGGSRWEGLHGGEDGYSPAIHLLHAEVNWADLEESADISLDVMLNEKALRRREIGQRNRRLTFLTGEKKTTKHFQKGHRLTLGIPGIARYEYFKAHDPWRLA